MKNQVEVLYDEMCGFAVFGGVTRTPLMARFFEIGGAAGEDARRRAYGAFVAEIYAAGGNLTELVRRLVFRDENVYVKAVGNMQSVNPHIARAVARELEILSRFAALTPQDFATHIGGGDYLAGFDSTPCDLASEYERRVAEIGRHGYGIFATCGMFSVGDEGEILPIASADRITLDRFIGYADEREKVIHNTVAFLEGRPAANVLLYGDAGTGKSSTVKAIANAYFDAGLRLIEIRKDRLALLPRVMDAISDNPLKFIIFIDDLSFNKNDDTFSMLKATLEGSACARAENALIYATSNRRHIVKESFGDREGDDIHRNDTVQELLSLSERFGLTVAFSKPEKRLYLEIVHELAARHGIERDPETLEREAEAFALRRGYRSARCAEQFVESLM